MSRIVASSPNYLATSNVLKKNAHKVVVIPYGLDKATYPQPTPEKLAFWRAQLGQKFFLFVGVLRYYKGLHILLEAAQGTPYPVVIVGAGPVEQELKAQAAQLGLSNVTFLGQLSDVDKVALLMLCYGVVFPSHLRSEAFGISLLEGAMYGKPMISSEIGTGTTFVNIGNETGLVVPPSDPAALRQAMATCGITRMKPQKWAARQSKGTGTSLPQTRWWMRMWNFIELWRAECANTTAATCIKEITS